MAWRLGLRRNEVPEVDMYSYVYYGSCRRNQIKIQQPGGPGVWYASHDNSSSTAATFVRKYKDLIDININHSIVLIFSYK